MTRRALYLVGLLMAGAIAAVLGAVSALMWTGPGRALLARVVSEESGRLLRGTLTVGSLSGNFLTGIAITDLEVRDTSGALLIAVPEAEIGFRIRSLLQGRVVLDQVTLDRPRVELIQHRGGRLNLDEILKSGEGPPGGNPIWLELRQLRVANGHVRVAAPWNYPGQLRSDRARDSALTANRAIPGREIIDGPEGLTEIRTISGLNAHIPQLRISTPQNDPIRAVINTLEARVSDPALDIRALSGTLETAGDSLQFALARLELPGTSATGRGRVNWPQDTLLFNAEFVAPRLALADLRFISPDFPDYTGRARARLTATNGTLLRTEVQELSVGDATSGLDGELVALAHVQRGLGFQRLDLQLRDVDLEVVRPYLDTLPLRGTISGSLQADGYFDAMQVSLDWLFQDASVAGSPLSRIALAGRISTGGPDGFTFYEVALPTADLDLGTVRNVAPAVLLEGRLALSGTLDGAWTDATFAGLMEHRDGERAPTQAEGTFHLDTRTPDTRVAADLMFNPLSPSGLATTFPQLEGQQPLIGRVLVEGPTDSLVLDASLTGALGQVQARGVVRLDGEAPTAQGLLLVFEQLDLSALDSAAPSTTLQGSLLVDGMVDTTGTPRGDLVVSLGPGTIREVAIDSAQAHLQVLDGRLVIDSAQVSWPGGRSRADGTLGWQAPDSGTVRFWFESHDLSSLDSLFRGVSGWASDTLLRRPLSGSLWIGGQLTGSLDQLRAEMTAEADTIGIDGWLLPRSEAGLVWHGGADPRIEAGLVADSVGRGEVRFHAIRATASGPLDSLSWSGGLRGGSTTGLTAAGRWMTRDGQQVAIDTVFLDLGRNTWTLREPAVVTLGDSVVTVGTLAVTAADGSGSLELVGDLPARSEGNLEVRLHGFSVQDLYGLLQQDTAGVGGELSLDLRISGTARAPRLRGSLSARGPVFGEVRAPLARAVLNYENRLLESNVTFWRTGEPILEVEARVPIDLAFEGAAADRFLPGPIEIRAFADSLDLAVVEALTPNLRRVTGTLVADVHAGGTWARPELSGQVEVRNAGLTVPSLGVRYQPVSGTVRLSGDSLWFDQVAISGSSSLSTGLFQRAASSGSLAIRGAIGFPRLSTPELRLQLAGTDFLLLDVRDFLTARVQGNVQLRGPLWQPVLTGSGRATSGVLYFADLVSKSVVNLWDPAVADLVDTLELRRLRLGAAFQSRFLDSLRIDALNFTVDQDFWLRSNEANVQLVGNIIVNKLRDRYRMDGTLNTPRGTYSLKVGPVVREFVVQSGTVRYFGTPDLNADLDINATHQLRSAEVGSDDVTVTARIGGTILVPKLELETDIRPAIPQRDIIALLVLGRLGGGPGSSADAFSIQSGLAALSGVLTGYLSSELSRALISEGGLPLDIIEIRAPFDAGRESFAGGPTQLVAGRALGRKWFVTLNAGFCSDFAFAARNFGASLEYRLNREWRLQVSAEPGQICSVAGISSAALALQRYQFGADLRWEREF